MSDSDEFSESSREVSSSSEGSSDDHNEELCELSELKSTPYKANILETSSPSSPAPVSVAKRMDEIRKYVASKVKERQSHDAFARVLA